MNWEEVAASRRGTGASGRSSDKEKAEWNPFTPSVICYRDDAPDLGSEASVSLVIGHSQTRCQGKGPLGSMSQCQECEERLVRRPRSLELHCVQVLQMHISGHLGDWLLALHPQAWDLPLPLRAEQGLLSTEASSPGCGAWDSQPRKGKEANFTVKSFQHFLLDIYYSTVVCKILWRI